MTSCMFTNYDRSSVIRYDMYCNNNNVYSLSAIAAEKYYENITIDKTIH